MKIQFITNICTHYVSKVFELLSAKYSIKFYFTGGDEHYWNKLNANLHHKISGKVLKGFYLLPKLKIIPGLFSFFRKKTDIYIKTLDGRFTLPFIFMVAKIQRKPFILWTGLWSHPRMLIHKITYPLTKFIYQRSNAIVVYGEHVKKYLIQCGVKSEKIFCAPHSTDNSVMNKDVSHEEASNLRQELGLVGKKIILYVGRFEDCKGLKYLIDGASNITGINCTVVFIGNGSKAQELDDQCKLVGLDYLILDYVPNEDLHKYYSIADIFVLPSITTKDFKEPWGIVVNEAMNQNCPVIATDAVGAAMGGLIEDGRNGFVVKEQNSIMLREAIERLLTDDHLRDDMGRQAKLKVDSWTQEKTMEGFEKAINFVNAH